MNATSTRRVGFFLGLGIFLMPFIFSWFTLRRGHSTLARIIALGWLAAAIIFGGTPAAEKAINHHSQSVVDQANAAMEAQDRADMAKPATPENEERQLSIKSMALAEDDYAGQIKAYSRLIELNPTEPTYQRLLKQAQGGVIVEALIKTNRALTGSPALEENGDLVLVLDYQPKSVWSEEEYINGLSFVLEKIGKALIKQPNYQLASTLRLEGTAPFTDQYGNEENKRVLSVRYSVADLGKINWNSGTLPFIMLNLGEFSYGPTIKQGAAEYCTAGKKEIMPRFCDDF